MSLRHLKRVWRRLRDRPRVLHLLSAQLESGNPPQVRQAFERLRRIGMSEREIWRLLRIVLEREIEAMLRTRRVFDPLDYAGALDALPEVCREVSRR